MAHYATDCWDLEIHTSYGWIECAGHADRACYDLQVHAEATNTSMLAAQRLDKPTVIEVTKMEPDRKAIGKTFQKEQKLVVKALDEIATDNDAVDEFASKLNREGSALLNGFKIESNMVKFSKTKKEVQEIKFLPHVIEPSFGIGRILYALMEHSFFQSPEDDKRIVMRFNAQVAPTKCNVYPLQSNAKFPAVVNRVSDILTAAGVPNKVDASGQSIGRRYARADELGVPFGITVDFDT